MIELKRVCNLRTDAAKFLTKRRRELRIPSTGTDNSGELPRILNQEKDGTILFTWDDVAESSKGAVVTHVGLYDPTSQKYEVVWTYNQRVKIISCSINQGRSLIAFTILTVSKDETLATKVNGKSSQDLYCAYLAEIRAPNTRVFSLNLERPHFLKVQFIYNIQASTRDSHLVVMLHRESIGLYHIQLGRVGEKGVIMRNQPKTEQLTKKFFWCQWDCQHQRLFYIHYRRVGNSEGGHVQSMLSSIQFYQNAQHDNILDVPINFPFPHIKTSSKLQYSSDCFSHGIPDSFLNLAVLTQANGTFCICYQKMETPYTIDRKTPVKRSRKSPGQNPSPLNLSLSESEDELTEINYYVCMVHHAKTLAGNVTGLPVSKSYRLHFSWHGDYLMVMLPGHFVHLLNVGIEFEPCHHIMLHEKSVSSVISIENNDAAKERNQPSSPSSSSPDQDHQEDCYVSVLSPLADKLFHLSNTCPHEILRDTPTGVCLYDYKNGDAWKIHVNLESLIQIFVNCYLATTRAALLHYVLIITRDFFLTKRLFEMLSNDIASNEIPNLFAEFLVGSTYANMRRQIDREHLRLVPFTVCDTFRGQFEKNADGERFARISYSTLQSVNIGTKTAKERQQKRGSYGEDLWDILRHHLRWMQIEKFPRFSHLAVHRALDRMDKSAQGNKSNVIQSQTTDVQAFMSSFHITRKRSMSPGLVHPSFNSNMKRVRPDTVLGTAPPFLQGNNISESSNRNLALTKDIMSSHLQKYFRKDARNMSQNVAKEYVNCQVQQSRQLCHLLWHLRGPLLPYTDLDFLPNLTDPSTEDEYELFQLFERYYLTCQDLTFPQPQGFVSYFTALGYRNLPLSLFLQYVDRGVLQLTGEFLAQVLVDIKDENGGVKLKQQLISRLPQSFADECYRRWNHPICLQYIAQKQVSELLQEYRKNLDTYSLTQDPLPRRNSSGSASSGEVECSSFPPLTSFLQLLQKLDKNKHGLSASQSSRRSPSSNLDIQFLEETALYHTHTDTDLDMGKVNL